METNRRVLALRTRARESDLEMDESVNVESSEPVVLDVKIKGKMSYGEWKKLMGGELEADEQMALIAKYVEADDRVPMDEIWRALQTVMGVANQKKLKMR